MHGNIDEIERATYGITKAKEIVVLASGAFFNSTPMEPDRAKRLACIMDVVEEILTDAETEVNDAISAYYKAVK